MLKRSCLLLGAVVALTGFAHAADEPAWELKPGGRWQQVQRPTTAPVQDETLDRVEEMLQNNQARAAKKIVVAWIHTHQTSPLRDRAVFLLAQANFLYGDRLDAYYNFEEILDLYPDSRYYPLSLQREYDIADQFLRGYKRVFLGLRILEATSEATEILYRIQQRSPGSPLAEKSLLRVADFYYANADFDLAADAYAAYVRSYPKSPYIPRVRLRQAFSSLAQFHGIRFDATPIVDARKQIEVMMKDYPVLAEEENLPAIVARIDIALAKKLLVTGDFLKKTNNPQAAAYYYKFLVEQYPGYPEAEEGERKLRTLPANVVAKVNPPAPATQPASEPSTPAIPERR
jgi:outer membrane assembly lipoprotein YfiO